MAYTPTVWKNGDVITAELLNHLETGVQNEQVGPEGPAGHTGAAAGFGTPTATVDANVGTPAVEITATGDDTAKVFAFAFSNLRVNRVLLVPRVNRVQQVLLVRLVPL